jgi:acyl-CoA synthetase (AMP-forming)/AMP-acid ligase II
VHVDDALEKHRYTVILQDGDDSSIKGINGTGFLRGARVGIVAKPSAEFVAGVFGTWLSGGVAVPLALSYPEVELLHVMNDSVCPELITVFLCLCLSRI